MHWQTNFQSLNLQTIFKRQVMLNQSPAISTPYELGSRVVDPAGDVEMMLRPMDQAGSAGEMELGLVMDSWTRGVADDSPWNPQVGRGRGGVGRTPVPPTSPFTTTTHSSKNFSPE